MLRERPTTCYRTSIQISIPCAISNRSRIFSNRRADLRTIAEAPFRLAANPQADRSAPYGAAESRILSHTACEAARAAVCTWPGYSPTPLRSLDGIAQREGLDAIWYKDESSRFGLDSFKALGGAYGVQKLLQRLISERTAATEVSVQDLIDRRYQETASGVTVTCATAGNHGRSVAWGAQLFGCKCVIYLPAVTSHQREAAIASYGAEIVRTSTNYDDAVRRCDQDASRLGRFVVSDTSYPGYLEIPRDVMQGYTVMAAEIVEQLPACARPTHLFVQAGVGGLAAAMIAHLWEAWGVERPLTVVVEPDSADPVFRSATAGRPTPVPGDYHTIMAGLAAGEISLLAWEILQRSADYVIAIPDSAAEATMRLLADGVEADPRIVAGESAVAGLAAGLLALQDREARAALHLGSGTRLLVIGTEGATDPDSYFRIVGRHAEEIATPA
jgi:diaminopropionate ammonia-lyase